MRIHSGRNTRISSILQQQGMVQILEICPDIYAVGATASSTRGVVFGG